MFGTIISMGVMGRVRRYRLWAVAVAILAAGAAVALLLLYAGARFSPRVGAEPPLEPSPVPSWPPAAITILPSSSEVQELGTGYPGCGEIPAVANAISSGASVTLAGMSVEITLSEDEGADVTGAAIEVTAAQQVTLPAFERCSTELEANPGRAAVLGGGPALRLPAAGHSESLPALDRGAGKDIVIDLLAPGGPQRGPVAYSWRITLVVAGFGKPATLESQTSVLLAEPG